VISVRVAVYGFPERDQVILKRLFELTRHRQRTYEITAENGRGSAHLCLVDFDDADALTAWSAAEHHRGRPVLMVSAEPAKVSGYPVLPRPIVSSRLLSMLDELDLVTGKDATNRFNVLVVDDSPTVRKDVEIALRAYDAYCEFATSGEEALALVHKSEFDLVLLDVVLPGADGYQVCKTLKRDPAFKHMPVVMLTSKSSPFDKVRGSLAGCDTYLTKPVDKETFTAVVGKYRAAATKTAAREVGAALVVNGAATAAAIE